VKVTLPCRTRPYLNRLGVLPAVGKGKICLATWKAGDVSVNDTPREGSCHEETMTIELNHTVVRRATRSLRQSSLRGCSDYRSMSRPSGTSRRSELMRPSRSILTTITRPQTGRHPSLCVQGQRSGVRRDFRPHSGGGHHLWIRAAVAGRSTDQPSRRRTRRLLLRSEWTHPRTAYGGIKTTGRNDTYERSVTWPLRSSSTLLSRTSTSR
jgi:hypothetical protein